MGAPEPVSTRPAPLPPGRPRGGEPEVIPLRGEGPKGEAFVPEAVPAGTVPGSGAGEVEREDVPAEYREQIERYRRLLLEPGEEEDAEAK